MIESKSVLNSLILLQKYHSLIKQTKFEWLKIIHIFFKFSIKKLVDFFAKFPKNLQ